jgi:hypothetical protein
MRLKYGSESMPRRAKPKPEVDSNTSKSSLLQAVGQSLNSLTGVHFDVIHVRRVVAGNPNTPKQILEKLAGDDFPAIRRRTAENPNTPIVVLNKLAADPHSDVRLAVAENLSTPQETLAVLAFDEDMDVRYGVAENPHMPEEILVQLCEDENPYIRCRALKTLQMLSPTSQSRLRVLVQAGMSELPARHRQESNKFSKQSDAGM